MDNRLTPCYDWCLQNELITEFRSSLSSPRMGRRREEEKLAPCSDTLAWGPGRLNSSGRETRSRWGGYLWGWDLDLGRREVCHGEVIVGVLKYVKSESGANWKTNPPPRTHQRTKSRSWEGNFLFHVLSCAVNLLYSN